MEKHRKLNKGSVCRVKQPVRVLIADDRRSARQGLRALLSFCPQIEVLDEAADGQECVDLVAERKPDVVLMDMQMPLMNGLEATRLIKSRWPEIKVIALTMYAKHRQEALAAGADVFLLKGCAIETLQENILA